ncbi:hypothetical protein ONZ43_g617 [Nemania bipapillata]|uniref:Uncharacterized protein n=1 Tax=Nemania bipapillata TaxID=110536 RepID=A0ACC2J7G5_9PEZI|nr:hypothetical protein ONZ43_g617 [Nemania bipapillata]
MVGINDDEPIVPVPAPWKLKATVYILSFWNSKTFSAEGKGNGSAQKEARPPPIAYSPLEAKSSFADPAMSGEYFGGLSQIQIIRYTESPVGTYDELIVCPGFFGYEKEDDKGKRRKMKNVRITRIYVSQKYTCWNGRNNWNIPKHLARFEWEELQGGGTRVRIYPHDTVAPSDSSDSAVSESSPSEKFLFQATFQPMRWAPSFPLSLSWLKYVGIDSSLVQPPLPDGRQEDSQVNEELIGTSRWCKIQPALATKKAMLGWMDMSQQGDNTDGSSNSDHGAGSQYENFWPGLRRWNFGIKMENTDIEFGEGLYWDPPGT